jgi:hypothetical protein
MNGIEKLLLPLVLTFLAIGLSYWIGFGTVEERVLFDG